MVPTNDFMVLRIKVRFYVPKDDLVENVVSEQLKLIMRSVCTSENDLIILKSNLAEAVQEDEDMQHARMVEESRRQWDMHGM